MRLHIGSGSVYLDGWVNVDVPAPKTFLAGDRPDLVEKWRTTDAHYYAKHQDKTIDTLAAGPLDQEYVCDRYGSFAFLPVADGQVTDALSRHAFEHLSCAEAIVALRNLYRAMKTKGVLRLDVPDHVQTLELFAETGNPFYIRHLVGPRRGQHGVHMQSYSSTGLRELVQAHGFKFLEEEMNIHLYPAICLRFQRQ